MLGPRSRHAARRGPASGANRPEGGQAIPEYVAAVLLVAVLFGALLALAGPPIPGAGLARALAAKLVCAVGGGPGCGDVRPPLRAPTPVEAAYGAELAAILRQRAPEISFEDGDFASLPVDYRDCRRRSCADSILHGALTHTQSGLPAVAFVHVVDCRDPGAAAKRGYVCSGSRAGRAYLQYWLYYPDSATHGLGRLGGYHEDDWESYQVMIGPGGVALARASSHQGYNGRSGGLGSLASDAGVDGQGGWDTILNQLHVAAGSHAGTSQAEGDETRHIPRGALRLIPLEPIAAGGNAPDFEVSPPWEKAVWRDPASEAT